MTPCHATTYLHPRRCSVVSTHGLLTNKKYFVQDLCSVNTTLKKSLTISDDDAQVTTELGTRQFFSFVTTTTRQRSIASETSQGPEKNRKIFRPQCLDGAATINLVKWQLQTI